MTQNQINRYRALTEAKSQAEQARHNIASEYLQERDVASNEVYRDRSGRAALSQAAARHRAAGAAEMQAKTALQRQIEDARHNLVSETQNRNELAFQRTKLQSDIEQREADRAVEESKVKGLNTHYMNQDFETRLHNRNTEGETATHNRADELIRQMLAEAQKSQAETAQGRLENEKWRTLAQNVRDYVGSGAEVLRIINQMRSSGQLSADDIDERVWEIINEYFAKP